MVGVDVGVGEAVGDPSGDGEASTVGDGDAVAVGEALGVTTVGVPTRFTAPALSAVTPVSVTADVPLLNSRTTSGASPPAG